MITSDELIEDFDGAPLPPELQVGTPIDEAVFTTLLKKLRWEPQERIREIANFQLIALAPVLWPWLPSNDERDLTGLDRYQLREAGYPVLGDEQCCELGCDGGACESCPCCCAGWCVNGRGEIPRPDDTENYRIWLDVAREHNPMARRLAELEQERGMVFDE